MDVRSIDRLVLLERIDKIEADGRTGAAQGFRSHVSTFLDWCANRGLIAASPMAGYPKSRTTKAKRANKPGRALGDGEIAALWRASEAEGWPCGPYVQTLILTGQRRTETAVMRWEDLDLHASVWTIPAHVTKSGRAHQVPLPAELVAMLEWLPRTSSKLVFAGHGGKATGERRPIRDVAW